MFAIRQIIDKPQDTILVPLEMRHLPIEIIFITLETSALNSQMIDDPIAQFCNSGAGGTTSRLLIERQSELVSSE